MKDWFRNTMCGRILLLPFIIIVLLSVSLSTIMFYIIKSILLICVYPIWVCIEFLLTGKMHNLKSFNDLVDLIKL